MNVLIHTNINIKFTRIIFLIQLTYNKFKKEIFFLKLKFSSHVSRFSVEYKRWTKKSSEDWKVTNKIPVVVQDQLLHGLARQHCLYLDEVLFENLTRADSD